MKPQLKLMLKYKLHKWALSSTAHALPKLANTSSILPLHLMWIFFSILSVSFFSYLSIKNLMDYLTFDVTTKINIINESPIVFPTITICNINPFSGNLSNDIIDQLLSKFYNTICIMSN